jgi:hypothetical protein
MLQPRSLSSSRRFSLVRPVLATLATLALATALNAPAAQAADKKSGGKGDKAEAPFVCTQIMGVSVTGDWFGAGFEKGVDEKRFQAITRKHAFIQLWGDPKDPIWTEPVVSPCAEHSASPDRVVFTTVNWEFKTTEQWVDAMTKVVKVLQEKYPGLRRIELLTMLRAPGNKTCGNDMSVVAPPIDEAIAKVVAAFPKLVKPGPKLEAPSCDVFTKGGPHYTPEGMAAVAKVYAAHYATK